MFGSLKRLIAEFGENESASRFDENDYRLAAAALLVHAAAVDGFVSDPEREKLHAIVMRLFDLDEQSAAVLIGDATEAERNAIDLYRFTSRLDRAMDEQGRRRMVEMLWEVVYADDRVTEFESNLLWRAADLLHVSQADRIALRQRVKSGKENS